MTNTGNILHGGNVEETYFVVGKNQALFFEEIKRRLRDGWSMVGTPDYRLNTVLFVKLK